MKANNRFLLFGSIIWGLGLNSTVASNAAESVKLNPLRLAYSAITVNQAIPWISLEAGHFKKHGINIELIHASSISALQALLGWGGIDRAIGDGWGREFQS